MNSFSLGGDCPEKPRLQEQQLRDACNRRTGDYSTNVREFSFLLRIDGEIHRYTELLQIVGAQKAKRKRDWIEVEAGIPKPWWLERRMTPTKNDPADEVEAGFRSVIELLQRNKRSINAQALLDDWGRIKAAYLA